MELNIPLDESPFSKRDMNEAWNRNHNKPKSSKRVVKESALKRARKIWKCDCGNEDQGRIIIALDGEVVCGVCATVLGEVPVSLEKQEQTEGWNEDADLCRKILEERVSRKGWNF
jgi:hypothetical protein